MKGSTESIYELVKKNINEYGYHVTIVNSPVEPRFAYTIGLSKKIGFELMIAGAIYYLKDDLFVIFNSIVNELKNNKPLTKRIKINSLGDFSFSQISPSWRKLMMLGVLDFYHTDAFDAWQILPDKEHYTLDIPNLSKEFDSKAEPVWKWLITEWNYSVPKNSTVVTNLAALKGEKITEVMRWEEGEWEMFAGAGPDVPKEEIRVVSLGTLLGIDQTLSPAINLNVGKGLWRDPIELVWNDWG
jgi:hypothetical protein